MVSVAFPQPGFWPGSWRKIGDEYHVRLACRCIEVNTFPRGASKRELVEMARDAATRRCDRCKGGGQ